MTSTEMSTYIGLWGAVVSTLLALVRFWEFWQNRFRIDVSYNFTNSETEGNKIFIRNLSGNPLILSYWELLYLSGRWPRRTLELVEYPEHDAGDCRIEPYSTHALGFYEGHHFEWGHKALNGRKIYIRLHIAGRKPILKLVYPS
jgi:hypothetical protein